MLYKIIFQLIFVLIKLSWQFLIKLTKMVTLLLIIAQAHINLNILKICGMELLIFIEGNHQKNNYTILI